MTKRRIDTVLFCDHNYLPLAFQSKTPEGGGYIVKLAPWMPEMQTTNRKGVTMRWTQAAVYSLNAYLISEEGEPPAALWFGCAVLYTFDPALLTSSATGERLYPTNEDLSNAWKQDGKLSIIEQTRAEMETNWPAELIAEVL